MSHLIVGHKRWTQRAKRVVEEDELSTSKLVDSGEGTAPS